MNNATQHTATTITTRDGVQIYYKDWGPRTGQPVVLSHGWPLNADSWESAAFHLANNGFRVITHDRRGHGRSSQPWDGNDMDHYAEDLAQLIEALDLKNIILAGFSTGGGEVARYVGRHGTGRIAKLGLISAVPPLMLKPIPIPAACRSKCSTASAPARSPTAPSSTWISPPVRSTTTTVRAPSRRRASSKPGMRRACRPATRTPTTRSRRSRKPTSATTLKKFDKPTLIIHGEDDQIVPIAAAGRASAAIVKHAKLITYPGAPHGLTDTHKDKFNADFLAFAQS